MNRIEKLFQSKDKEILTIYFTAGFPNLHDTTQIIRLLAQSGVDLIEIGMPFSDPLADGEVIQKSSEVALENGMTIELLFEQLKNIRKETQIPLVLMGYLNPVLQFGVENFCKACAEVGVDGVILPDLPLQEYIDEYKATFEKHGLFNIFLITPQTSEARIRKIDEVSKGFIYLVAQATTTGTKSGVSEEQEAYFKRIVGMNLKNPTQIGFGISDAESFQKACRYAKGAIIGSAFIKHIAQTKDLDKSVVEFVEKIRKKESNKNLDVVVDATDIALELGDGIDIIDGIIDGFSGLID